MKLFRWLGIVYLGIILVNFVGCEAPHHHHTEVMHEQVIEQEEIVE